MKKSVALFFLIVFSISLPGYSVEVHFCEGKITDVALFGNASCVCENKKAPVAVEEEHHHAGCKKHCQPEKAEANKEVTKFHKECCKTEKLTLTSSKLKAHSSHKITQVVLMAAAILNPYIITDLIREREAESTPYLPPLIQRDLQILNSVFII